MDISIPYYQDNSRVSNSAIGWFLNKGPAYFRAKLSGEVEDETTSAMSRGTAIHMYLLQPDEFQKTYKVWTGNKPSSAQQEKFCRALVDSVEIEPEKALLSAYKAAYSTSGKIDDTLLQKASELASTLNEYITYLKNPSYELLSYYEYNRILAIGENVKKHKLASKLLAPTEGETYHEFHINWDFEPNLDMSVPCKSLLDSLNIDVKNKTVTLMDIKTTTKLHHFKDSMDQYDYARQLEFYTLAIEWYLKNERGIVLDDSWTINRYIIAVDTTGTNEVRVFDFNSISWHNVFVDEEIKIRHVLYDIHWHTFNNKWEHYREYYEGDGAEMLNP